MSKVIKLKRGLDIPMAGQAEKILTQAEMPEWFALQPPDFPGLTPRLSVKVNDRVQAGSSLFYDKYRPEIRFTSPVSGKVVAVNRGHRRRILEVVVEYDGEMKYETFAKGDPDRMSRDEIVQNLLKSGLFPLIRQRPYGIVASPEDVPRDIFISAFDTAPLAPDMDFVIKDGKEDFRTGIQVLRKLTSGEVHLGMHAELTFSPVFKEAENVKTHLFSGPHPSGNVGIQIHHVAPVNRGEKVWTVNPQDVLLIGRLFSKGLLDATRIVALTGSEVLKPRYYRTMLGASVKKLLENNLTGERIRVISGNVLTGRRISREGFIGFYDSQITVVPEGNYHGFLGWAMPRLDKFSASRAFFSWLQPNRKFRLDTNLHGGKRSFVMTGEYEKVLPMDIYPLQLLKSILIGDIDKMEQLGIYEVVEEDLALCEFVCTSKTDVQSILREGIQLMIKELGS
ncbi:MAG: Na(+)-translocating NADH-quinone reductase subunit A [Bacteroidales bacterium]